MIFKCPDNKFVMERKCCFKNLVSIRSHVLRICLLSLYILPTLNALSQEEIKPKVALVLSGGGAKGIAHIPVLQALDSLGIVPDLIVGTSMGSVVGGLYAMGYSGDSIAYIAKHADWNKLLGSESFLRDVGVEEKTEYGRYLLNLDFIKGKPKVKSSLLKDQNLRVFLSEIMYPAYNMSDFDKLPIPFRAVATDLVNGQIVVMDQGSLELAVRASMSIPSIFQPIPYKETLLVDGGVVDNFPTDIAKELGADIIIGSDVGGGLLPIERLDNIATILFQTSMLTSKLKDTENRALCDILIDHVENLSYSTSDFSAATNIYTQGQKALTGNITALAELAKRLEPFKQRSHSLPEVEDAFVFDTINYHRISNENLNLLKARIGIEINKTYTIKEIIHGIGRAMGTELFYQITYHIDYAEGKHILNLYGSEKSRQQANGALHYDTNQGVGLVVNYTGRNILGYSSRSLISLDIAEEPKYRVQYQQSVGDTKMWWWRTESFGQQVVQNYYINGYSGDDLKTSYNDLSMQLNKNLNSLNNYVGVAFNYEFEKSKPKLSPDANNNVYNLRSYKYKNFEFDLYFNHNSMDRIFFATSGMYIHGVLSRSLWNHVNKNFYNNFQNNASNPLQGFSKFRFQFENRVALSPRTTLITSVTNAFMFMDVIHGNQVSLDDYGQGAKYMLGGNLVSPLRDKFIFSGLDNSELIVTQFIKVHVGSQINLINKVYITPYINLASVGFGDFRNYLENVFASNGNWVNTKYTSMLFSTGTTLSYDSILGPVNLDVSYINSANKVRVFFNVGLRLRIPY